MQRPRGWSALFWSAFKRSRNPMVLLDDRRYHVEVNGAYLRLVGYRRTTLIGHPIHEVVAGGPLVASPREWQALLETNEFTGVADLVHSDGHRVTVQYAAQIETVTGRRLVLVVELNTARGGRRARLVEAAAPAALSDRELEIVRMIALGNSSVEIADELHISHHTVRTHVRNAMIKLGVRSRAQLVARSLGEGIALGRAAK